MPVVTGQGLVGRIIEVTANASRVLLINSESSATSARLQTTRFEGTVRGVGSGGMRMSMIPLNAQVQIGDIVLTSGLGGNLPGDIVIGQITSNSQLVSGTEQTAEIRSLVNFDRLEMVLVITNFEPVDQSLFESGDDNRDDF
jgi:rod shape-determining protein MreC